MNFVTVAMCIVGESCIKACICVDFFYWLEEAVLLNSLKDRGYSRLNVNAKNPADYFNLLTVISPSVQLLFLSFFIQDSVCKYLALHHVLFSTLTDFCASLSGICILFILMTGNQNFHS